MNAWRRQTCLALSAWVASFPLARTAIAQIAASGQPPVRIVCQLAPGGLSDRLARLLAHALQARWNRAVIVENRSGASGIIATDHVAKSAPDGHTILITIPAAITTHLGLYRKLPYDALADLRLVGDVAIPKTLLAVHPDLPARNFSELISHLRTTTAPVGFGSWGVGSIGHLMQAYIHRTQGARAIHVPYRGEAPMVADLMGGAIGVAVVTLATSQQHLQSGSLRAIAVTGPRRIDALPWIPTFREQGFQDALYGLEGPISLAVPSRTPERTVQELSRAVVEAIADPAVRDQMINAGAEPVGNGAAVADARWRKAVPVWMELTAGTGVTLDVPP